MVKICHDWHDNELTLQADETGTFRGRNSNFNGEGFSRQTFKVHSVDQSEFDSWVKDAKSKKTLSQDEFDKQLLPSTPNKELTFSGTHMAFVDPVLIQSTSSTLTNVTTMFKRS